MSDSVQSTAGIIWNPTLYYYRQTTIRSPRLNCAPQPYCNDRSGSASSREASGDVPLAFSPERENLGNKRLPKSIGALNCWSALAAQDLCNKKRSEEGSRSLPSRGQQAPPSKGYSEGQNHLPGPCLRQEVYRWIDVEPYVRQERSRYLCGGRAQAVMPSRGFLSSAHRPNVVAV